MRDIHWTTGLLRLQIGAMIAVTVSLEDAKPLAAVVVKGAISIARRDATLLGRCCLFIFQICNNTGSQDSAFASGRVCGGAMTGRSSEESLLTAGNIAGQDFILWDVGLDVVCTSSESALLLNADGGAHNSDSTYRRLLWVLSLASALAHLLERP